MLKTRILTALVLLPLMLAALFAFPAPAWALFCGVMVLLALWEYSRMVSLTGLAQWGYLLLSAAIGAACWYQHIKLPVLGHVVALGFWLVVVPVWLSKQWVVRRPIPGWLLGWLLMFPAWFALLEWREQLTAAMSWQLLAVMGLVWVADVAAYAAGRLFGKRKLAPSISPGKSWAGVYGALIAVVVYSVGVYRGGWLTITLPYWLLIVVSVLLTAVSICGDLLESWFKRSAGIKDSSKLLPGHGGVYDRIDSLIAVLAVSNALRVLCNL